jgi:hypothetical protein
VYGPASVAKLWDVRFARGLYGFGVWTWILALAGTAAAAPARELVIANENLVEAGEHLEQNLDGFLRRVEEVAGWPKGALKGKVFTRPREVLDHIRKNKTAFAILPAHQFVEGRKQLRFEVLGRAVGVERTSLWYRALVRRPRTFEEITERPGLRLAMTETYDIRWINVLFGGRVQAASHFTLFEVPSDRAALEAVLQKKADVALIFEREWRAIEARAQEPSGELEVVTASPKIPPMAFVAVGRNAKPADRRIMAKAIDKLCKTTGADACARVGIAYMEVGLADSYQEIIDLYSYFR